MLPSDQKIVQNLRAQNLGYTLTVCFSSGEDKIYKIGSLWEILWGVEQPEAVVEKIADPAMEIITLTITEGGYNINKETNEFNLNDEKVRHDIENKEQPETVFGFVAQGLRKRRDNSGGVVTVLCCDNLQHNGDTAKNLSYPLFKLRRRCWHIGWRPTYRSLQYGRPHDAFDHD